MSRFEVWRNFLTLLCNLIEVIQRGQINILKKKWFSISCPVLTLAWSDKYFEKEMIFYIMPRFDVK